MKYVVAALSEVTGCIGLCQCDEGKSKQLFAHGLIPESYLGVEWYEQ